MSTKIEGNVIRHTRGDTLRLKVEILKDEAKYNPRDGDIVRFALKHKDLTEDKTEFEDKDPLILKVIPNDSMVLELAPDDTKPLGFGQYAYDIQITFADGTVDTFITKEKFYLTEEVE